MKLIPPSAGPKRLVLLRHGRTAWNRIGRAQGHADISLDKLGVAQAKSAARQLSAYAPALIWSSDLARARETAERLVAVTEHELVFDKRLREFDVGVRQGLTFDEFVARFPELSARLRTGERVDVPGAETTEEVSSRMVAVLQDAAEALGDQETAILVGHGASLRTGLLSFLRVAEDRHEILAGMANCAWAVLELHRHRGWQIIDYNAQTLPESPELADDL